MELLPALMGPSSFLPLFPAIVDLPSKSIGHCPGVFQCLFDPHKLVVAEGVF